MPIPPPIPSSGLQYQPLDSLEDRHARGMQLTGMLQSADPAADAERILQVWRDAGGAATAEQPFELDVSATEGVDSSGVACMLYLRRRVLESGGQMRITGVTPRLYAILELLGCLTALGVEASEA